MRRDIPTIRQIGTLTLALLLWLAGPACAAPTLNIDRDFRQTDLSRYLDILDADAAGIKAPRVYASQFRPLGADDLAPYRTPRWLRFGLINRTDTTRTLILQVRPAAVAPETAVSGSPGAAIKALPESRLSPLAGLFEVHLPPRSSALFYVRSGINPLASGSAAVFSLDRFLALSGQQGWVNGSVLGLLILLALFCLIASPLLRDSIYLWLAAVAAWHAMPLAVFWALQEHLLHLPLQYLSRIIYLCWMLAAASVLRLALRFPAWPRESTAWPRLLHGGSIALLLIALVMLWRPSLVGPTGVSVLTLLAVLISATGALHAYFRRHDRLQLWFALARLGIFAVAAVAGLSQLGGDQPHLYLLSLISAAASVETLALLLVLIMRSLRRQERWATQQRAIAVAEAESRARTEATAAMAHRIRTPVSGILGMLEMLQDTPLSDTQRDSLETMQRAGSELLNAVNELSDISRLDLIASPLQRGSFDLQALVAECVEGFRGLAAGRSLELITDLAPGLPRYVSGDQTRLRQLLLQLLHHAIAHFSNGEVVLRADAIERRQHFELTVHGRDGTAPSPDTLPDPTLRLAIARQLVATLAGDIRFTRSGEAIWRVDFELPLPALERRQTPVESEQVLRHRRLLVIDDSDTFREVVQRQAAHWGMQVHGAATLSEGLARLRNQATVDEPIDILLLDAELPELAGSDSHRRLREAGLPPAVILLATLPEAEHSTLATAIAARRVLFKPIDQTSLHLALQEELNLPPPRRQPARAEALSLRCLIAEDNPINAQVLQGMLNKLEVATATAVNGQEAVELFQRQTFDIVLMDCDMPVMDGFEAARQIREIQRNRGDTPTPIIALTANTLEELGERARTGLMDAHLVKPVRLQSLRQLLEHWCGRTLAVAGD